MHGKQFTLIVEVIEYLNYISPSARGRDLIRNAHTYTAGASLLRPIVKKNREINWKQSSKTVSTVIY